jgi:hypothetical protein
VHPQKGQVLYWPPRPVHPLEVRPVYRIAISRSGSNARVVVIRQTVFYTPTTLTLSKGQTITGRLTCAPNTRNNRDLDILITHKLTEDDETTIQYKMCVPFPFVAFFVVSCPAAPPSMRQRWESYANRVLGLDFGPFLLYPLSPPPPFTAFYLSYCSSPSRQVLIGPLPRPGAPPIQAKTVSVVVFSVPVPPI